MAEVAAKLDDGTVRDVAEYYERLPPRGPQASADTAALERGRAIAAKGIPERDIPACVECHGPTTLPKNRAYPQLTAQHGEYLSWQLGLMQQRRRGGTPNVDLMHVFVSRLREREIRDVTSFYAALPMNVDGSVLATR
jgi:cytochrome c553